MAGPATFSRYQVPPLTPELQLALQTSFASLRPTPFPRFIGNHPEDVTRDTLKSLHPDTHSLAAKLDGTRMLVSRTITEHSARVECSVCWCVTDRRHKTTMLCSEVGSCDQRDGKASDLTLVLKVTDIWDAEMLWDSSLQLYRLHVFDSLLIDAGSVIKSPFLERFNHLKSRLIELGCTSGKTLSLKKPQLAFSSYIPCDLELKPLLAPAQAWALLNDARLDLEGLVIYRNTSRYFEKGGVYRWKHGSITIDLLVRHRGEGMLCDLFAWTGGDNYVAVAVRDGLRSVCPDNTVAEFACHANEPQALTWDFIRIRSDRHQPNHIRRVDFLKALAQSPIDANEIRKRFDIASCVKHVVSSSLASGL